MKYSSDHQSPKNEELAKYTLNDLSVRAPGKYIFSGIIAQGGMKEIIKIRDKDTSRDIAMATILDPSPSLSTMGQFLREARITANLEHPNIVPIHDIGVNENKSPYFTMKLIDGESLGDIIKRLKKPEHAHNYSLTQLLQFYRQVLNAMIFAHAKGVIHLDLSPENIIIGKFGEVLILDWGLAKLLDEPDEINDSLMSQTNVEFRHRLHSTPLDATRDGIAQGTPGYMAPEQAAGLNSIQSKRTDIYALGAILYNILTLSPPFSNSNISVLLEDTIHGNFVPPKEKSQDRYIPTALEAVTMKAMATVPENRYQSVLELRNELDSFFEGRATHAEQPTPLRHLFLYFRRHTLPLLLSVTIISILFSYATSWFLNDYISAWHWTPVIEEHFSQLKSESINSFQCMNPYGHSLKNPFILSDKGFIIPPQHCLWMPYSKPRIDSKIKMNFISKSSDFDIFWGTLQTITTNSHHVPPGYTIQIRNKHISVSYNTLTGEPKIFSESFFPQNKTQFYEIVIQRIKGQLHIYLNNSKILVTDDPYPAIDFNHSRIGIRPMESEIIFESIKIYQPASDTQIYPLAIAEILSQNNQNQEAYQSFLDIAQKSSLDSNLSKQAFHRLFALAASRPSEIPQITEKLERLLKSPDNNLIQESIDHLHASLCEIYWQQQNYTQSINHYHQISNLKLKRLTAMHLLNEFNKADPIIINELQSLINQSAS